MLVRAILLPVFVEILLIFVLLFWTGGLRSSALRSGAVRPENIALGEPLWPPTALQFGNAFNNQFQLPVLFFVLVAFEIETRHADLIMVALAWVFVLLRLAHAVVHTTANRVQIRGPVYGIGALVLLAMWIIFAVRLILTV